MNHLDFGIFIEVDELWLSTLSELLMLYRLSILSWILNFGVSKDEPNVFTDSIPHLLIEVVEEVADESEDIS